MCLFMKNCQVQNFIIILINWAPQIKTIRIYRRLLIGRDGNLDQSEAYDISWLVREYGPSDILFDLKLAENCIYTQQTRRVGPMLGWCWASVVDDGPASAQHWANASSLVGTVLAVLGIKGGGPRVVVSTAAFHAGVRFPVSAVWKKQKCFFPIHVWKLVLWGASVTER